MVGFDDDFIDAEGHQYKGANFRHYSGNMICWSSGETVLPPYNIVWVDAGGGRKLVIRFIHLTVSGTETGSTSYQPALASLDEIATVNKYAAELKAGGVNAIIVSMHDGAVASSNFNGGSNPSGPAYTLAQQVSPDIAAIVTGHWHCLFNMMVRVPERPGRSGADRDRAAHRLDCDQRGPDLQPGAGRRPASRHRHVRPGLGNDRIRRSDPHRDRDRAADPRRARGAVDDPQRRNRPVRAARRLAQRPVQLRREPAARQPGRSGRRPHRRRGTRRR